MANESVCLFFTEGSSVEIGMQSYRLHGTEEPIPDEVEITFFDATLAHFEHYTKEELDQNASMNKAIVMDEDGWGVQVDTADYEPEVFTLSSGDRHYLQNITRTGKHCYLTQYTGKNAPGKNATSGDSFRSVPLVIIQSTNNTLPSRQTIGMITFIALTFYSLAISLIVWYWSLPRIIFWRELASFFFCLIIIVQEARRRGSIVAEAMQSCFNVSLLALYFKPDNILTPLIVGLSLLQAILFIEERYVRVCMGDIVIFAIVLMVNLLFVKKAWDKRSKLGVLVQLERLWILIERFFAPHTFKVMMSFLCQSSFYKNYFLYDETFSINGFSIEYQTYCVLLKLLVIGGGLYCAKPQASHTKRHKRASNAHVLLMLALCVASVFLLVGLILPVLHRHECIRFDNFSPRGYLAADVFIPRTDLSFEKGFRYPEPRF
jgi:hypothetical protein